MEHDQREIKRRAMSLVAHGSLMAALLLGFGALLLQRIHPFASGLMILACIFFAAMYGGAKVECELLMEQMGARR